MLYLVDANVLIDAHRDFYPIDRVPEFWEWLEHHGNEGNIRIPLEIYEEIKSGNDALTAWIRQKEITEALLLKEDADPGRVADVVNNGYGSDLNDIEIEKIGRDPFLISYATVDLSQRCVVTTEASRPSAQGANRRIPDVCTDLGASCCNTFELTRQLDFSTSWKTKIGL